jgi:hypothetical protein
LCAFFLANFPNIKVLPDTELKEPVHVVVEAYHNSSSDHLEKYKDCPNLKLICISGEPHGIKSKIMHLIIDCKREPRMLPDGVQWIYLPFYVVSFAERLHHPSSLLIPPGFAQQDAIQLMKRKTRFCAFMYSNSVPHRDAFFHAMERYYKKADALGAACNKDIRPLESTRMLYDPLHKTYYEDAVEQYEPYKFVIAIENARIKGYITEKLTNPVLARCIPIYLGAPDLFDDNVFNRKAIIHIDDFDSYEDCIKYVREVDQSPELYLQYLREPLFVGNKLPVYFDANYIVPSIMNVVKS